MNAAVVVKTLTAAKKATLSSYPSDSGLWLKSGTAPISSTSRSSKPPHEERHRRKESSRHELRATLATSRNRLHLPYLSCSSKPPLEEHYRREEAYGRGLQEILATSWPLPETAYISFTSSVPENLPVKNVYAKKPLIVDSEQYWPLSETASICFIAPIDDLPLKTVSARTEPVLTSYPLESGLPWLKSESASIYLMASMPSVSDIPQHIPALVVVNEDKLGNQNDKLEKENRPAILNT
ncbi:hypothetical protein K435DRAFT_846967, partial [Dendrothele bispora CBS 962.96]